MNFAKDTENSITMNRHINIIISAFIGISCLAFSCVGATFSVYSERVLFLFSLPVGVFILLKNKRIVGLTYLVLAISEFILTIRYWIYGGNNILYSCYYILLSVVLILLYFVGEKKLNNKSKSIYVFFSIFAVGAIRSALLISHFLNGGISKVELLHRGLMLISFCYIYFTSGIWYCLVDDVKTSYRKRMKIAATLITIVVASVFGLYSFSDLLFTKQMNTTTSQYYDADNMVTICDVYNNKRGIVTIVSDDGYYFSGQYLNELAVKHDINVTVAGVSEIINNDLENWKKVVEQGHVELISHSYSHRKMSTNSDIAQNVDELKHQIQDSIAYLENEFGTKQVAFVCPENVMCNIGYNVFSYTDITAIRRGVRGYNSLNPESGIEPYEWSNLVVQGICDDNVSTLERNEWINTAIANHAWLIEMWHNVAFNDDGYYQTILYDDTDDVSMFICDDDDSVVFVNMIPGESVSLHF